MHASRKKKTTAAAMGSHARAAAKVSALLRNSGPAAEAKAPRELGPLRGAGCVYQLRRERPPHDSPLSADTHRRLRLVLAGKRYADCPKKSLPSVTVHSTARHITGILHASADYFGGPWHDGVEAELDGDEDARVRGYARALCIFTVNEGALESGEPRVLVCWYDGASKPAAASDHGEAPRNVYANPRLHMPHLALSKMDYSIIKVKDLIGIRWIVPDFDEEGRWWVVKYDGFGFHQHLGVD
jgi:hypothetical protein